MCTNLKVPEKGRNIVWIRRILRIGKERGWKMHITGERIDSRSSFADGVLMLLARVRELRRFYK